MSDLPASAGWNEVASLVPPDRLLYSVGPGRAEEPRDWAPAVRAALCNPLGAPPLAELVAPGRRVVILVDDVTRPTPQQRILPSVLSLLNEAGVGDEDVTLVVALGTHRYMTRAEMRARFGQEVCSRVRVINHAWKDPETFVDLGATPRGTPLRVNRTAREADLLMAVGSIVPHIYAGWGGGAKMAMPGICSHESIGPMHSLAWQEGDLLLVAGSRGTSARQEIEEAAARVGLDFILNVVLDADGACAWMGAGEPGQTHAAGIDEARRVYVRPVPRPADITVLDARPATMEYWQGIKALGHAARGIKAGGTAILVGEFPEGIETTHPEFASNALCSDEEIVDMWRKGEITDHVAVAPLRLHAQVRAHCRVICVSPGMSAEEKAMLGFAHADSVREALDLALAEHGASAEVGVVEFAGDVVPEVGPADPTMT